MVKVERGTLIRKIWPLAVFSALALTACGDDKKEDSDDENSQYVVMPFVLGDTAKIDGGSETTFSISRSDDVATPTAGLRSTRAHFDALYMDERAADHDARFLLNRFDSKKGLEQGDAFWRTVYRLDRYYQMKSGRDAMQLFAGEGAGPTEAAYRANAERAAAKAGLNSFAMTAAACPADGDEIEVPEANGAFGDGETRGVEIPAGGAEDATDFCLVYVDEPTTAGGKPAVKATVKTVMDRFKTVIYKDAFAPVGDYTFKPIVVVIDFGDGEKWPQLDPFQIAGAFIKDIGNNNYNQPVLFMASDNKKLKKNKDVPDAEFDKANATKVWHGTVAHEMQHAVVDYFKGHKADLGGEIAAIDEGLAHVIEDLFGYGQENFGGFAKPFLLAWANKDGGGYPILTAGEVTATDRGASQVFWYYLMSQKGGVTISGGAPASGGGLDFIAAVVKSGKRGVANLAEAYGGVWTDAVSGFYGALVLDGTKVEEGFTVDAKHKVQDTQTVTDLNGNTDKRFGMHYNGFEGLPDTRTYELTTESTRKLEDVTYYQTMPLLYTGAEVDKLTYSSDAADATNQGVAKIKIK